MASSAANSDVLNSWKEVACYLGRGVRTVQRWEQELGLPVHRPHGKSRSAVIAFRSELDQWLHRAPGELLQQEHTEEAANSEARRARLARQAKLHDKTTVLINKSKVLLSRSCSLCNNLKDLQQRVERTMQLTSAISERDKKKLGGPVPASAITTPTKHSAETNFKSSPARAKRQSNHMASSSPREVVPPEKNPALAS